MCFSCNRRWTLPIDKGMNRQDLKRMSGPGSTCIARLGNGGNVTAYVLMRICKAPHCDTPDIVECVYKIPEDRPADRRCAV